MKLCQHDECAKVSETIYEKKDACYTKVKSRYDVWPSAYASGALVKCRKVGAKNWGNKSKKEDVNEAQRTSVSKSELSKAIKQIRGKEKGFHKTIGITLIMKVSKELDVSPSIIYKSMIKYKVGTEHIKGVRFEAVNEETLLEDIQDLKKIVKELEGASKMHLGQSKRIQAHLDDMNVKEELLDENLLKQIKQAEKIAKSMSGNMTGAVKGIEKIRRGLSHHKRVKVALKKYNESVNESISAFDVDFYKDNNSNQTSHEEIIRGDKFSDVISKTTKVAKSKKMNYVELYYKGAFIGSIDKRNSFKFKKGRNHQKSPLSVTEADLGLTYKKGKTVKVKHKKSGKTLVIVDKPVVKKEYEKIGYYEVKPIKLKGKSGMGKISHFGMESVTENKCLCEACWKGYEKKGMKTMFGKEYPNCVKKEGIQTTTWVGLNEMYWENNIGEYGGFTFEVNEDLNEAEYQGRKVKLGKIMQGDVKKFKVYVNNPKGNVVKVNFGQGGDAKGGTMRIRKDNPGARKSFRARHNCDTPGPRHKARYWSCRKW